MVILKDGREHDPDVARVTYRCRKCLALLFVTESMNKLLQGDRLALPKFCPKCTGEQPEGEFK